MTDDTGDLRRALASHKIEIESLNGEVIATQTLLTCLLEQMLSISPVHVAAAFDSAANQLELSTLRHGKRASPHHLARALKIVEELRAAIIPAARKSEPGKPL